MIGIRRAAGWVLAGMAAVSSMLLLAPIGSATSPRSVPPPPPSGEPLPSVGLPLLTPPVALSATGSAGTQITLMALGLTTCATSHGDVALAGNAGPSAVVAGDAAASLEGGDPVGLIHLDEDLTLAAVVQLAQATPPNGDQVLPRCAGEESDDGGTDSPGTVPPVAVTPGPSDPTAAASGTGPAQQAEGPSTGSDEAQRDADATAGDTAEGGAPGEPLSVVDRAIGRPGDQLGSPGAGAAPLGAVIGVLGAVAAALVVPAVVSFALQNRRGKNWVRANVKTVAQAAPAMVTMTPQLDWPSLPTFEVRLAVRADSGSQAVTEVER